jgi:hypothetical protein
MDIKSLVPRILCNSHHHFEVNFMSQSLMIELGSPCSCTISHWYIHNNLDAFILVWTGIRWTMLVIQHIITQR